MSEASRDQMESVSMIGNNNSGNCNTVAQKNNNGKSDEWYLKELITALGDFYGTMLIEKDPAYLLRYVRHTDYDIEEAVILCHRSDEMIRSQEHLLRIPFENVRALFELGPEAALIFKNRDPEGRKVILFRINIWDPENVDLNTGITAVTYGVDELMMDIENQTKGCTFIIDFTGIGHFRALYLLSKVPHDYIMLLIKASQHTFPVKMGAIYTVNVPWIGAAIYNTFKYFITKRLRDKLHINYSGPEVLQKHFSKDFLPKCLEGNVPDDLCQDHEYFERLRNKKCRYAQFQPSKIC